MTSVVISSGHGLYVRGASSDMLDEVDEARRVVDKVTQELKSMGIDVVSYHDNISKSQNENLNRIVDFHNSRPPHDLDISVHFNAYEQVSKPMGTEVLYVTQSLFAAEMSNAIASCGFINRGAKKRTDLFFLNNTAMPAILIEVCFVDSEEDVAVYRENFNLICQHIASLISGDAVPAPAPEPEAAFHDIGKVSYFGGPADTGVSPSEGLAFHYAVTEANQHLFLPLQPHNTTGLARRLNAKAVNYVACRWDYAVTSKTMLAGSDVALVRNTVTGLALKAFPADWGPHQDTSRVADISPCLMDALGLETDDEVEVIYPYREDMA